MSTARGNDAGADGATETEQAEQVLRDAERLAEEWAASAGRWVARAVARAREEAEDIWAEAQDLRRGW